MNAARKLLDKKSPYLFFIKYLLCFLGLYLFFPFYQGVTGPGGRIYSSFLDKHFNLVRSFTSFLTGSARLVLEALHYSARQINYHTIRIGYSRGISVNPSCLGWAVMSFWVAFVFANNGSLKHKLKWMLTGVVAIILLNIIRIALIALANHSDWKMITSLDSHTTFNIFSYGIIFILMYVYTRVQKKYEGNGRNGKKQNHKLSAV